MWLRRRRSVGGRRVLTLFVKRDARIFCHAHAVPSHFGLFASSPLWPSCWCMLHSQCCYTNLHVRERDRYTIHCGIQHLSHVSSHGKRKRWAVSCAVASCWGERRRRQPPPPKKRHPPTKPQHLVILEKGKWLKGNMRRWMWIMGPEQCRSPIWSTSTRVTPFYMLVPTRMDNGQNPLLLAGRI